MNCERFQDELLEYVDGTLSADARAVADKHLAECDTCRQALEKERHLASVLSNRLKQSSQTLTLHPEVRRNILTACRQNGSAPTLAESLIGLCKYWVRMAVILVAMLLVAGFLLAIHFSGTRRHGTASVPIVQHVSAVTSAAENNPQRSVSVQVSYYLPRRQFHQEGNLVVDTLVDESVVASGTFQASDNESGSSKLEMKTPL